MRLAIMLLMFESLNAVAAPSWLTDVTPTAYGIASTPVASCEEGWRLYGVAQAGSYTYRDVHLTKVRDGLYKCWGTVVGISTAYENTLFQWTTPYPDLDCDNGVFDYDMGVCRPSELVGQKGTPVAKVCSLAGDPINFAVGNSIQTEVDYVGVGPDPLKFFRTYNSVDGIWRNNYSTHLRSDGITATVILYDGRQIIFTISGVVGVSVAPSAGSLFYKNQQWSYRSVDNDVYSFDSNGKLTEWLLHGGGKYTLTYTETDSDPGFTQVSDNRGRSLTFTQDAFYQPLSLSAPGYSVKYKYSSQALTGLTKSTQGVVTTRGYKYNFFGGAALLSDVTDERGIIAASWMYDSQGRAVSSRHAGGVGKVTISYSGGTTDVVNELGKSAKYTFVKLNDISMISSIQGEPSPSCPASNSSYTYDDMGHLLTETDARGYITTYTYNDRGLVTSRTEASGTPQARTTTIEWDATRFLRTKVVVPSHTTIYSYDEQGRETNQEIKIH